MAAPSALRQVLAGCARLVADGGITTEAGKKDYAALVLSLQGLSPQAAKQVEEAGRLARDNIFKPKEKEIRAVVARLEEADASDAEMLRGLIDEFWTLLKQCGDPIADLALGINRRGLSIASIISQNLRNALGTVYKNEINSPLEEGEDFIRIRRTGFLIPSASWRKQQGDWVELNFRRIQRDVALAHWEFVQIDDQGKKGLLSAGQIESYHVQIFTDKYNLPSGVFGGNFFGGRIDNPLNRLLVPL